MTIALAALLFGLVPAAQATPARCDVAGIETIGALDAALNAGAVEIVNLALDGSDEARLGQLVDPSAPFSLGGGDVGRPLGKGIAGARKMAREMNADSYRFLIWTSIPTPIDTPCAKREVTVEFIDTANSYVYPVKFAFENGRLIEAAGWTNIFQSGPLHRGQR